MKSSLRIFQLQRITAVGLLVFMTIHMVVVHYPPGHIDFSRVIDRLANPIWKVIDIAFLGTVLLHALLGAYDVLLDWENIAKFKRALAVFVIIIGIVFFIWGTITVIAFDPALIAEVSG